MNIPAELATQIDEAIARYPVSKRSATLPLLHLFQEHYGFISPQAISWIADKLGLQPINVLELVTFYPMFRQHPVGTFHIRICRTLSCAMAGSYELRDRLAQLAAIDLNAPAGHGHDLNGHADSSDHANGSHPPAGHEPPIRVSADGRVSIEFVECLASCGTAPICMVNDVFYENITPDKAGEILERCR